MAFFSNILRDMVETLKPDYWPEDVPDSVILQHGMNGLGRFPGTLDKGDFIFVRTGRPITPPYDRGIHSAFDVEDPADTHQAIYSIGYLEFFPDTIIPNLWTAYLVAGPGPTEWTWDLSIAPTPQDVPYHTSMGINPHTFIWQVVRDEEVLWEVGEPVA